MTYAVGDLVTVAAGLSGGGFSNTGGAGGAVAVPVSAKVSSIHPHPTRPTYTVIIEATGRSFAGLRDADLEPRT